jgi:hypothetical protein
MNSMKVLEPGLRHRNVTVVSEPNVSSPAVRSRLTA